MKKALSILLLAWLACLPKAALGQNTARADQAGLSAQLTPEGGHLVVEAHGVMPKSPLFFSVTSENVIGLGAEEITGEIKVAIRVVQGNPEVITLGLNGGGEVVEVKGEGLRDWSVRQAEGKRFLDLRPSLREGQPAPAQMNLTVKTKISKPSVPGSISLPTLSPGDAVGFASQIKLVPGDAVDLRITRADGLVPLGSDPKPHGERQFYGTGLANLEVMLIQRGASISDADLVGAQLSGKYDPEAGCVRFQLHGEARIRQAGARMTLLSGQAALSDASSGEGWHVELKDGQTDLVFDRAGSFPIDLSFVAAEREGEWKTLDFRMPAGAVVPMVIEGLAKEVSFNPNAAVVPDTATRKGFIAADGNASVGWRQTRESGVGTLSFTSHEESDVRVGAGLLRQTSKINFQVLQGKLPGIRIKLDGPGEILGVEGTNVLAWNVVPDGKLRALEVRLSRPLEKNGSLVVRSQSPLGNFPVRAEPLRLTPDGGVRHSGYVRVANDGAVRLEVADVAGMMQLAPSQFPGGAVEPGTRQVFVYRFPSASYAYRVVANQILPEVGVSQIVLYKLADTDRVITADIELDIREAPLREWSLGIPEDYAVVGVGGGSVADYVAETETKEGQRVLKILFGAAVDGRQLIHLRLEKNQAASAGSWTLPPLVYPGAKSVRGHIGVVSTPGFRILPGKMDQLVETPLSYFPTQVAGLQQAFRQREANWSATLTVEALGQSVQADVFHLYSLKEGVVYGSVLINYFVVGAPSSEWRIEVPESAGNIDVVGQNVRRDWRREGNQLIVSLHQPVLGAATLLVTFEQPMSARGGIIKPGEVRPLGVQGERGYLQVVSPLQVKSQVLKADGALLKLEPAELPAEFRLLTSSPSLAVYQYTARPFAMEMDIKWYAPADTVDQLVDFVTLASRISRDGQIVTDARYFVKTRGRKALRIVLPENVKLWEARADKEVVNAQVDGEQTLIPLPPKLNPNESVEVVLRLGQTAKYATSPVLSSPKTMAPTVISEWSVTGDPGQLLVPKGGTAQLTGPVLTETGFEWVSARAAIQTLLLLVAIAVGGYILRIGTSWKSLLGFVIVGGVALAALNLALAATQERRPNLAKVSYAATVVPAGESVTVRMDNVGSRQAMISPWGIAAAVSGIALLGLAILRIWSGAWQIPAGALLLASGILAQRGGAVVFFLLMALGVFAGLLLPAFIRWMRKPRPIVTATPVATTLIVLLGFSLSLVPPVHAEEIPPAESMVQTWKIQEGRLFGELDLQVRGASGDSFLMLRPPAVLTNFKGDDGLRVTKVQRGAQTLYFVALERTGAFHAHASFEMPAGDLGKGLYLVSGPAAVQRVTVQLDQGGWDFTSPSAVSVQSLPGLPENESGATLVLRPSDSPVIHLRTRVRDTAAEKTQFFAEVANLFVPGPGVVNGYSRITLRPVQGQVSSLELEIPNGFTVGDVRNGPVSAWRFDPKSRKLRVEIAPAQAGTFKFDVESQLGTADLPVDLTLEPVRVLGPEGEVGMIALAFGGDAQPENVRGLSPVNLEDFDAGLIPTSKDGQPLALLQQAFRYGREGGRISLKVAPVAPEVRVVTRQVLTFGDDRLVLAVDLNVAITRAGLFKLSFPLPAGLEVEAISGGALSQWTEAREGDQRVITMQLNGRTLGDQRFALTLVGAAPAAQEAWPVPRLLLREATRQIGELMLVPDKGIRLRAVKRENVSQLDSRAAGETQAGSLAFRLLQENWSLQLGIEALEPWITVHALQEVTVREGQTLTRLALHYRVDNASVKQLRLRLPGLSESQVQTVRGTGPMVNDLVQIPNEKDLWEIRFQHGIAGETDVQIEYQGQAARENGKEVIQPPAFDGARQITQFVSVRGSGRIELDASTLPRGWQRVDWSAVPANLQDRSDRSVPALCFRVAEAEMPLAVNIQRHNVADALKLRVTKGDLTTLFSPLGPSLTSVQLVVEVVEKSSLRINLPKDARLFSAFVNEESVSVVREGDAYLLNVSPNTDADRSAKVRLIYSVPDAQSGSIELIGPRLNVPLVNVSWRVIVPPGYSLANYRGSLRLEEQTASSFFGLQEYRKLASDMRNTETQKAAAWINQANSLLRQGEQQKAGEVLSKAANAWALDEASNEDARVQLKTLKTQQAVVGLNTRRQRLYLDNRNTDSARNEQLEQAANANPFMQGGTNFDPQQMDQLLMGNTAEENSALKGIAGRIVDQQLAAEPAPGAIDVTIPESGKILTFTRSIQVDGEAPLGLKLNLTSTQGANGWYVALLLLAVAALAAFGFPSSQGSHLPWKKWQGLRARFGVR
ncbi:hypothetical protein BH09VER1_BH09VER1_32070 [soil metagenome]